MDVLVTCIDKPLHSVNTLFLYHELLIICNLRLQWEKENQLLSSVIILYTIVRYTSLIIGTGDIVIIVVTRSHIIDSLC